MTYNVFSGTLNPTQSINQSLVSSANPSTCRSWPSFGILFLLIQVDGFRGDQVDHGRYGQL